MQLTQWAVHIARSNVIIMFKRSLKQLRVAAAVCLLLLLLLLLPGMLYCMEYLAANLDWLKEKLQPLEDSE
jgi:hypothetical protein